MERSSTRDVSRLERKRAVPEPGCQGETHSRFLFSTSLCFSVLARSDRRLSRMHAFRSSRTRLLVIAEASRYGSGRAKGRARTPSNWPGVTGAYAWTCLKRCLMMMHRAR